MSKKAARGLLLALVFGLGQCVFASGATGVDCISAFEPYSSKTVLLDLLLDPRSRAVLEAGPDSVLGKAPPDLQRTTTPTFAAIITARDLATFLGTSIDFAKLDAALAQIPIATADAQRRCARYDHVAPRLPSPMRHPAILLFDKSTGFRDEPSVRAADAAIDAMAARRNWFVVRTDNAAAFSAGQLASFDAVVWNNVSGDVLTVPQQRALRRYVESGGGFAAMHGSGGDFVYPWAWYADTLIGARFTGHPREPHFQQGRVVVEAKQHPVAAGLGAEWQMSEEWYSFASSPRSRSRGATIIATLDERSYQPGELAMGDHPIAWTQCIGQGRSFYSAIGHRPESYSQPQSQRLLEQGIAWAAAKVPCLP